MSIHLYCVDEYKEAYEKCLAIVPAKLLEQKLVYTPGERKFHSHSYGILGLFDLKTQTNLGAAFVSIETGVSNQQLSNYIINLCKIVERDKVKYFIFTGSSKVFRVFESCILQGLLKRDKLFIYHEEQRYTFSDDGYLFDGENDILKLPDGFFGFNKEQLAKSHYRF